MATEEGQVLEATEEFAEAPLPKNRQLESFVACRREMARVYWAVKHGKMEIDKGKALVHFLGQISAVLKVEQATPDDELAALLKKLKERVQ